MALAPAPLLQSPTHLPWIVQKFGGAGVGKFVDTIARQIVKETMKHNRVAVVCSARSGGTKLTGTRSRLIRALEAALSPEKGDCVSIANEILADHLAAVRQTISDAELRRTLEREIMHECSRLRPVLEAAQALKDLSAEVRDAVIGVGEKLACKIVTAALRDRSVDSVFVSLEDVIDDVRYGSKDLHVLDQSFYDRLAGHIAEKVQTSAGHRVPVVTGYFGSVPGGLLTAVGRGYTDLCAALVAVGLGAEKIQIWKELDGVFVREAEELTGFEVVHPLTMEQVIRARIPIYIKDLDRPFHRGTLITAAGSSATPPSSPGEEKEDRAFKGPTAVTIKESIVVLNIRSNRTKINHMFFAGIFSILDRYSIVVDLVAASDVQVSIALCMKTNGDKDLVQVLDELRTLGRVDVCRNMAILTLVAKKIGHMAGLAGILFTTLAFTGINIEMISQGASEINISCVIHEASVTAALNIIHTQILCNNDEQALRFTATAATTSLPPKKKIESINGVVFPIPDAL